MESNPALRNVSVTVLAMPGVSLAFTTRNSTVAGLAGRVSRRVLRSVIAPNVVVGVAVGFDSIRDADDDPLYPASDLRCWGEIRYGGAGAQAARTVLVVAPCATLVRDDRLDDSVEFAVGALYTDTALTDDQQAQLAAIRQASTPPAVIEGVTQAAPPVPTTFPLPTATCPS